MSAMALGPVLLSGPPRVPHDPLLKAPRHTAYAAMAQRLAALLRGRGVEVLEIAGPEQFKDARYAELLGVPLAGRPHLMVRDVADIRPIAGAYNIAVCALPLPLVSGGSPAHVPVLEDQRFMLSLADEVWAVSDAVKTVLEAAGVVVRRVVPAPIVGHPDRSAQMRTDCWARLSELIALPLVSSSNPSVLTPEEKLAEEARLIARYAAPLGRHAALADALAPEGKVVLSVGNVLHSRKNMANLIDGFLLATADRADCVLVIKLTASDDRGDPLPETIRAFRRLLGRPHCLHEPRVLIVGERLDDVAMQDLFGGADLYLCASMGEGQNLSTMQAMADGLLTVSTASTSMADYVDETTAAVIAERPGVGQMIYPVDYLNPLPYDLPACDRYQIASALRRALALSPEAATGRGTAARQRVEALCGPDVVYAALERGLREVSPQQALAGATTSAA